MENKTAPIYVVVSDGSVQEIKNIPAEARVQVIDKDEEFVESERWEISPVDGEACTGKTFSAHGKRLKFHRMVKAPPPGAEGSNQRKIDPGAILDHQNRAGLDDR